MKTWKWCAAGAAVGLFAWALPAWAQDAAADSAVVSQIGEQVRSFLEAFVPGIDARFVAWLVTVIERFPWAIPIVLTIERLGAVPLVREFWDALMLRVTGHSYRLFWERWKPVINFGLAVLAGWLTTGNWIAGFIAAGFWTGGKAVARSVKATPEGVARAAKMG